MSIHLSIHPSLQKVPFIPNFCRCSTYLDLIALPGVESHPLIVLAGIGNFLVINPLNGGVFQEGTDLRNTCHVVCTLVHSLLLNGNVRLRVYLIVGPESSFTCIWTSWCSTTSWGSNTSVWWWQTEGTAIRSKSHPQLLHWSAIVSPVLHGIVLILECKDNQVY